MKLLLLLSALLAALSGAGAEARAAQPRTVEMVQRVVQPEREAAHAHVLLAAWPEAAPAEAAPFAAPVISLAGSRLWMQRRRE